MKSRIVTLLDLAMLVPPGLFDRAAAARSVALAAADYAEQQKLLTNHSQTDRIPL